MLKDSKILKDKAGNKLTVSEFMARWKEGINGITPLQQTASMLWGYWVTLIGIIWGIIFAAWHKQWWLVAILVGSIIVSGTQLLGTYQKYNAYKKLDEMMKGGQLQIDE